MISVVMVEIIAIREAPQPKRLTTGLGWWNLSGTMSWPGDLTAMKRLGMNTVPLFARWIKAENREETLAFLDRARKSGFAIIHTKADHCKIIILTT